MTTISIIVTSNSLNRLNDIFMLFDSIKKQSYRDFEIIFVAEKFHELQERLEEYVNRNMIKNVILLFNNGEPGLSEARNLALLKAQGEIFAFVDDDVILPSTWAQIVFQSFNLNDDIIGVTGAALPLWESEEISWLPIQFHWLISCTSWFNWNDIIEVRNVWGHNMAFKKIAFEKAGLFSTKTGYHKGLMAEDLEFSLRVRSKLQKHIIYNPNLFVWHKVNIDRLSPKYIRKRAYWIGYSRRSLKKLLNNMPPHDPSSSFPEKYVLNNLIYGILSWIFVIPSGKYTSPLTRMKLLIITLWYIFLGYFIPSIAENVLQ